MPIPQVLRDRHQWLVWRFEKKAGQDKPAKMPYYANGKRRHGKQGTPQDRTDLVTLQMALDAKSRGKYDGVGFAFLPDDGLAGIDLDRVLEPATGELDERAVNIIRALDSYTEKSPSGKGVHIIVGTELTGPFKSFKRNEIGVEVFCGAQFFTFTGDPYAGSTLEVRPLSIENLKRLRVTVKGKPADMPAAAPGGENDFARVNDAAMRSLSAWVPTLFPAARAYNGGYRVSSADLGRDLQEELSILPEGIVDWGVADQGDARAGRRTPIDLVIEWSSNKTPKAALHWLSAQLGITLSARAGSARPPPEGDRRGPDRDDPPPPDDGGNAPDDRPEIRWVQGKLHECVNEAEDALIKAGRQIYQRAGFLVRVVRRDTPSVRHYKRRQPGALGIVMVDPPFLIEEFTRSAHWVKWNARAKPKDDPEGPPGAWTPMNAPEQAANTYMSRRGHWQLPRLWSAISAPTLRPDGTVLQSPGYDADTQSWYEPCGVKFPDIPTEPDTDDAKKALAVFAEAFKSFPFESEVDRSVALALALTAIVRRSLPSAPLGGITAPAMGTGKTLLADCISILAVGVSAPAMKYADTDEEATKTMLAILAEGDQVVLIDNVERPLQGAEICAVLTSETYRQRMLGKTEMMTVPTTTLWLATGNHLVIQGDLRTRALLCRMDAKTEHPEQRQFEVEKREWMTEHRPELVAAGLTIMRAFIATKQVPKDFCKTWGRFERWSDFVRAPLIWLGCEDPCASLKDLEKEDPERRELLRVLSAWKLCFGDEPKTAAEAIAAANKAAAADPEFRDAPASALDDALREICKGRDGKLDSRRLGHWLRQHADRIVSDPAPQAGSGQAQPKPPAPIHAARCFQRAGERDHTLLWKVVAMS